MKFVTTLILFPTEIKQEDKEKSPTKDGRWQKKNCIINKLVSMSFK
jgi:hypothetical protein